MYINEMKECARQFQKHRFKMFQMQQDIPTDQLLSSLNAKLGDNFWDILRESRGVDDTKEKLRKAEDNQKEIEMLIRQIGDLGSKIDAKLEQLNIQLQ